MAKAIKFYKLSLQLDSNGFNATMNLAVIYGMQKKYSKALSFYKKLIDLKPESPEGYYGACQTLVNSGNDEKAISYCQEAAKIYNSSNSEYFGDVAYILCLAYYNTKNYPEAKRYLKIAKSYKISINPTVNSKIQSK